MVNNNINPQIICNKLLDVVAEIEKVIVGKHDTVEMLIVSLLAGGHCLIEDVPGVGKTTLVLALGRATGLLCRRAQFTPDVMASDITGFTMFDKEQDCFKYKEGMIMCNIFLADEINRTSPKTQSALLEAMEGHVINVDGETHNLPMPFIVVATQNELGYIGTFPLPEAQLDRFLMKIAIGYPTIEQEVAIVSDRHYSDPLQSVCEVCTREDILEAIECTKNVYIADALIQYIVEVIAATRNSNAIALGASPRASLALMRCSQAEAFLAGRSYVTPEDIVKLIPYIVPHRIMLTNAMKQKKINEVDVINSLVKSIKIP